MVFLTGVLQGIRPVLAIAQELPTDSVAVETVLPQPAAFPFGISLKRASPLVSLPSDQIKPVIRRNADGKYILEQRIYGLSLLPEAEQSLESIARLTLAIARQENMETLLKEAQAKQETAKGLLDFKIAIPGGSKSAFTTIFGKPEVNLSVTGRANMSIGASVVNDKSFAAQQQRTTRIDPTFNQNLQLNIQGTIGDKLSIRTDWDTERQFDYQNRLSIVYEGYEDEILKRVEMGNVSMETGNSLVRGGGALFGIKSTAQMGALKITSVLSQKQGSSQTESYKAGSKERTLSKRPSDYDDDRHFFIDYFLRNAFEEALSDPNRILLPLENLNQVRVYKRVTTSSLNNDGVRAVALADLGVVRGNLPGVYLHPDNREDRFDDELLNSFRDKENLTAQDLGVADEDFISDVFQELIPGQDYEVNLQLGFISFRSPLQSGQSIGISFQYTRGGEVIQVGELLPVGSRQTVYLKMIRPGIATPSHKLWPLTMRNFYYVDANGLLPEGTNISVQFTGVNPARIFLPDVTASKNLMQDLGLDRLGPQNSPTPDNLIDFGLTFNGNDGLIMFPYLEPFGQRISTLIDNSLSEDKEALKARYVFDALYSRPKGEAVNLSLNANYEISGILKGGTESSFQLGFALVEGSVKVSANGSPLAEGIDFEVDYSLGFIRIINEAYLKPGFDISIEYENNNLIQIQQTTFTGVRAEYEYNENLRFGSTVFRFKELPQTDKIRVGDEPINNTVIGLDGSGKFDAPWLTRFIDRIPLLQTKEPSSISFSGEYAQLLPNVARTPEVDRLADKGKLFKDEVNGVSFIDDFEGVENTVSLMNAFRWNLAAAPAGIPGYDAGFESAVSFPAAFSDRIARNNLRAQFSWYVLPVLNTNVRLGPESELLRIDDVFNRQVAANDNFLRTLDFYYNPNERGPYNYNPNLRTVLETQPEKLWGGITSTVPQGQENLTQNNIEFLEFWVQFILPDGRSATPADLEEYKGRLIIDLGQISEDVVPNSQLNSEDGLSEQQGKVVDGIGQSFIQSAVSVIRDGAFSNGAIDEEDVGLDGVRNSNGNEPDAEQKLFSGFLEQMNVAYADNPEKLVQIQRDPSNDDYVFWNGDTAKARATTLHERFYRFLGYHEGNSAPGTQAYNKPDTEGLQSNIMQTANRYFQYEIALNPADTASLAIGKNGVVDRVSFTPRGREKRDYHRFYQVRIPIKQWTRKVGGISDFTAISHIRMWLTGYKKPFTMRFATFEFVGSQWRKATEAYVDVPTVGFQAATINREENLNRRPIPYRTPEGAITAVNRGQQNLNANEQSVLLKVEDLPRGDYRLIARVFNNGLNLLNYRNMRMFVHGEGYDRRSDAEIVIRFGNDLTNNYYEYRQPVTPSSPSFPYEFTDLGFKPNSDELLKTLDELWKPDENSVNVPLAVFNVLKQKRNTQQIPDSGVYVQDVLALLPDASGVAPGAKVAIKGASPTLSKVTVFSVGIVNPVKLQGDGSVDPETGVAFLSGEFWLNELRVSGFDNRNGWKAAARTSVKLADFANLSANYNESTEGYAGIDSKLGTRQRFNDRNVDLSSQINLHKLIPDRYGWNVPLNISYRNAYLQNVFLTQEADIRWTDFQNAIQSREDLADDEQKDVLRSKLEEIERVREDFAIGLNNIGKQYSKNKFMQATIDNLKFTANYNVSDERSPQSLRTFNWKYDASLNYTYTFKTQTFWQPFSWLSDVPVLKHLDALRFSFKPTSISGATAISRTYSENTLRVYGTDLPRIQPQHDMFTSSNMAVNFNLMPTVTLGYSNATRFNLANLGRDTTRKGTGPDSLRIYLNSTPETLQRLITDPEARAQRNGYGEKWNFAWRPKISNVKSLNWLTYSMSYNGGFDWANADIRSIDNPSRNQRLGSTVQNSGTFTHTARINFEDLYKRIPGYEKAKEADRKQTRERDIESKKRRDEALKRKMERQKQKLESKKASAAAVSPAPGDSSARTEPVKKPVPAGKKEITAAGQPSQNASAPRQSPQKPIKSNDVRAEQRQPVKADAEKPGVPKPGTAGKISQGTGAQDPKAVKDQNAVKNALTNADPLVYYARKMLLNASSFRALDLTYSQRTNATQAGYRGNAPIYYMFSDNQDQVSPALGFRTGLQSRFTTDNILIQPLQRINTTWSTSDNLTARTQFTPVKNMNVDLNWSVEWGERNDRIFSMDTSRVVTGTLNSSGTFSSSTVALGRGYESLFRRQLGTAYGDIFNNTLNDTLGNGDGRFVLEPNTLHSDFKQAYLGRAGRRNLGKIGIGVLPLPNWNISYAGLEAAFPFLQDYVSRISLTHAYRGRFRAGYAFNPNASQSAQNNRLGDFTYRPVLEENTPNQSAVESAFSPLIGLNISWRNQMRTTLDYERSRRAEFSYSSGTITETMTSGVKFSFNYEKRGFKLPFMKKLQNTLTSSFNLGYSEDITTKLLLGEDLSRNLKNESPSLIARDPSIAVYLPANPNGTGRIQGSAVVGYQFSSMIQANFEYRYTHILPRSTNSFERITHDILFNISVAIRSN